MIQNSFFYRSLVIKPTTACNFNCSFCSAKKLNIPLHDKVPFALKQYILEKKPTCITITGGEPLMNPRSYYEDLIHIIESYSSEYEISLTSNLMLWYNEPAKYDYLFNNPKISVDTSFQYGNERKDDKVYTEERFIDLFQKFKDRYGRTLLFESVISPENEKYVLKTCELAKKLNTCTKLVCQLPIGLSTLYYPVYKLFSLYLDIVYAGLREYEIHLKSTTYTCPFPINNRLCQEGDAVYINEKEELVTGACETQLSSNTPVSIKKGSLFKKCYMCPLFGVCNNCSIYRAYNEPIKEMHCDWMKTHYNELIKNKII